MIKDLVLHLLRYVSILLVEHELLRFYVGKVFTMTMAILWSCARIWANSPRSVGDWRMRSSLSWMKGIWRNYQRLKKPNHTLRTTHHYRPPLNKSKFHIVCEFPPPPPACYDSSYRDCVDQTSTDCGQLSSKYFTRLAHSVITSKIG